MCSFDDKISVLVEVVLLTVIEKKISSNDLLVIPKHKNPV